VNRVALVYLEPRRTLNESLVGMDGDWLSLSFRCVIRPVKMWSCEEVEDMVRELGGILKMPNPPEGREDCEGCERLRRWFEGLKDYLQ
jgi:hypothetical protein